MFNKPCYAKLSVCNLSVTLGVVWGFSLLFLAYLAMWLHVGEPVVDLLGTLYVGYKMSYMGGLLGFAWGFADGFILGLMISLVYNFLRRHCPCKYCEDGRCGKTKD